ncbi:cation transport ATPase [uncultured Mediterranean phage uvMED]|nr:cation transport ATPase [uncultured Mediterranean phage uvMED]
MSNDGGKQDTGSDAGWSNVQSNKDFNKGNTWSGKSDDQVKKDIETRKETRAKETEFQNYNKPPVEYTGPIGAIKVLNWVGNKIGQSKFAKDTNLKNRTFFTDSVLSKKGVYDGNTKLSKSEFQSLSLEKQNEIYGNFMEDRMSGKTDAYGNPIGGNRRETIKHKNKDGTYTTKSVWMGGNDNDNNQQVRLTNEQITKQTEEAEEKDTKTEEEKEEDYKKVKGLKGSRSLFGNAGGRGYFDPA